MHGTNDLKFGMLIYPDHLQEWWDYGHGLLIFLILTTFWLSETGQICGFLEFSEMHWENGLQFDIMMYLCYIQNWLDICYSLLIFLILAEFWPNETGQIWVFQAFF